MENFRFILEPYNRHQRNRYTCPSCGKHREFTRYIDTQGAIFFPEYVGKCNRINNCGYHYTPAMYFDEHPECKEYNKSFPVVKDNIIAKTKRAEIENEMSKTSLFSLPFFSCIYWGLNNN